MSIRIGFVGAGKVGGTLAHLLRKSGYQITAVSSRTPEHAQQLAQHVLARAVQRPAEVIDGSDLVFLTVPDDAIGAVVFELAHLDWRGKFVVHTSGASSLDVLQPLAVQGAMVGSFHPIFPFANVLVSIEQIQGTSYALESDNQRLLALLQTMTQRLKGHYIVIPAGKKAFYHAALVLLSNYTVTLYATAQHMLLSLGAEADATDAALKALLTATTQNIVQQGIPAALTGPLSRADVGTIAAHVRALPDGDLRQVYIALARLTYPLLRQRGIDPQPIEDLFEQEDS